MPRLSRFRVMLLIALMFVLSYYWYNEDSCSYCFEQKLAKQVPENFSSAYMRNTITIAKHNSFNYLSEIGKTIPNEYIALVFFIALSTLSVYLFFRFLFGSNKVGMFSALVYLTNTTLPVTVNFIFYYFLALFCFYLFINKNKWYGILLFPIFFLTLNSDVSAGFVLFVTLAVLYGLHIVYKKDGMSRKLPWLLLLASLIMFFLYYEENFLVDFLERLPLVKDKLLFYVSSYPKGTYLYVLQKFALILIPAAYLVKSIKKNDAKDDFVFLYLLSVFPLLLIFVSFEITARIFDYYGPLLGAITFNRAKLLFRRKTRKIIITALILFFTFFSVYTHYIPPRSMERYDPEFLAGLKVISKDSVIYTDTFIASALIGMDYVRIKGADYNLNDEYNQVYYLKNETYIKNRFFKEGIDYFVISKHSLIRGLDILNAPHFLKPVTDIEDYDKMNFLSRYYSNEWVTIWVVKR